MKKNNFKTENPCVPGSIPGGTTKQIKPQIPLAKQGVFVYLNIEKEVRQCRYKTV